MAAVFVSYKRENLDRVQPLVEGLRREGISIWWDQDIAPDAPWETTIERELEIAKVVIVAWSAASVASENVKAEARRARGQGKLIQIFLERCDPPLFFGERQGVDLSDWTGSTSDRRFRAIVEGALALRSGRRPPPGVGYKAKTNTPWTMMLGAAAIASASLAFVANLEGARAMVCGFVSLSTVCPRPLAPTSPDPRQELLRAIEGVWGHRGDTHPCSETIKYEWRENPPNPPVLVTTHRDGSTVREQLLTADNGRVITEEVDPRPDGTRWQWTYQPDGEFMSAGAAGDNNPYSAALVRCGDSQ